MPTNPKKPEEEEEPNPLVDDEFDTRLEDEEIFDAHSPPGFEIGRLDLEVDRGSGSFAEDGRLEVAEDRLMMDGETQLGSAAMYGPTEIGSDDDVGFDEVGFDDVGGEDDVGLDDVGAAKVAHATQAVHQAHAAHAHAAKVVHHAAQAVHESHGAGHAPTQGQSEIGAAAKAVHAATAAHAHAAQAVHAAHAHVAHAAHAAPAVHRHGYLSHGAGHAASQGPSEIGSDSDIGAGLAALEGASEIGAGLAAVDGFSEIGAGAAADRPGHEIGAELLAPFETFMLEPTGIGDDEVGDDEVGYEGEDGIIGAGAAADRPGYEIGADAPPVAPSAVVKVIETARNNRKPPPPMKAVDHDAPLEEDEWGLADLMIGAAAVAPVNPFPLVSELLLRAGASIEPRIVRVDTEESYRQFREENSPEMSTLRHHLEAHIANQHAHGNEHAEEDGELDDDVSEDIEDLVILGAEVDAAEAGKRVELWMPKRFDGLVTAWTEGKFVCASITLPGSDGEVRICTTLEPIRKAVAEMSQHAAESGVPASTVIGVLPKMGCVLGAGTAVKEMAAAAPSILQRPEASRNQPFVVRIEPKTSPALAALAMLAAACRAGSAQACDEWKRLGEMSPPPVRQAMLEGMQLAKAAAGA